MKGKREGRAVEGRKEGMEEGRKEGNDDKDKKIEWTDDGNHIEGARPQHREGEHGTTDYDPPTPTSFYLFSLFPSCSLIDYATLHFELWLRTH